MRVLVTGGSSLPGYRVILEMLVRGHEVVGTYLAHKIPVGHPRFRAVKLDIRDKEALERLFEAFRPDAVIHMAAYGDVDGCERNKRTAWEVNAVGTANVARLASRIGSFLLYLSTDYVFDGERGGYREEDEPCPVNYYGLTKLAGEVAALSSGAEAAVVRASSIYGFGPGRVNFAKFLVERLSAGQEVKALVDQYTTPTQASLLARAAADIVERRLTGVFHVVGERMSRYEFAVRVAEALGLDKGLIKEARMEEFGWLAKRPRDSSLDARESVRRIGFDFRPTDEAMRILRAELEGGARP